MVHKGRLLVPKWYINGVYGGKKAQKICRCRSGVILEKASLSWPPLHKGAVERKRDRGIVGLRKPWQQPLRQKSKILATSLYTREALGCHMTEIFAFTGGASGAPAPAGGVAPVAFTERRGEGTPPYEGYHEVVRRGGVLPRPPNTGSICVHGVGGVPQGHSFRCASQRSSSAPYGMDTDNPSYF